LFLAILYFDIFRNTQELFELTESMMRLCVTAIGAFLGLYVSMTSGSEPEEDLPDKSLGENISAQPQKISIFLFLFSLLSFPMVYLSFIIFILSPLCLALWLLFLGLNATFMPQFIWILIIAIQTVCLLITFQTIHTTFILEPPIQPGLVIDQDINSTLKTIIKEVCEALRVPEPEILVLHAEPKIIVRKSNLNTFNGLLKQRSLCIGLPLLYTLNLKELKALIAFELAPFSGQDKLYSEFILPSYQIFSDSFAQMDNALLKLQRGKAQQGILSFIQFPHKFFLQIISGQFAQLDNFLTPARMRRAAVITQKHYAPEDLKHALIKKEKVEQYFGGTFSHMPFSEANIFREFHAMLEEYFKDTLDLKQDNIIKEVLTEIEPLELKISLIYQYFRHINRYYKEFYHLLKEFQGMNMLGNEMADGALSGRQNKKS
jgi:Zn-dependent protease with chaperone function